MNTQEIAQAVKNYLVELAINDKLPMDMNDLCVNTLESVIKGELPSQEEQYITKAMDYLCDGDISTKEMVQAIANHENQSDFIDNVEDVIVWVKVEWSFTCAEFLEMIDYVED